MLNTWIYGSNGFFQINKFSGQETDLSNLAQVKGRSVLDIGSFSASPICFHDPIPFDDRIEKSGRTWHVESASFLADFPSIAHMRG